MPTFHGIKWDFGTPEVTDIQMDLTVHSDPPRRPGTPISCVYLQLYDFRFFQSRPEFSSKGIHCYFGLQTDIKDNTRGLRLDPGLLYSRWQTSDPADVRTSPGGWAKFPDEREIIGEGGQWVGVRNKFAWGKGRYRLSLAPVSKDAVGMWYEFKAADLDTGDAVSCGQLRFPRIDGRCPQIPNWGGTWIEVIPHTFRLADFPAWHISFRNVVANCGSTPALTATANYADDQAPAMNSDISPGLSPGEVEFRVGARVERVTHKGKKIALH